MKKILFGLLMISVIVASCKKDNSKTNSPSTKLQKVTFNVGFSKTVTTFQTNSLIINSTTPDTSLTNYMDVLYYMVFDASGNNVHTITQLSTDTAFGHYIDNLKDGTYTVVVAGGKTGLMTTAQTIPLSSAYVFYGYLKGADLEFPSYYVAGPFTSDTFIGKTTVTISGSASGYAFTLNRIVSKLVVNINDAIPAGTTTLQVFVTNTANAYMVNDGSTAFVLDADPLSEYNTPSYSFGGSVPEASIGQSNYQVSSVVLNSATPAINTEIKAMAVSNVIADKTVNGVTFEPNKVTLLSGTLFGGSGGGSALQVTTNNVWNTPVIKTFP